MDISVGTDATSTSRARDGAILNRRHRAGLNCTVFRSGTIRELHLTVSPLPNETPFQTIHRLAGLLRGEDAAVARVEVFGSLDGHGQVQEAFTKEFGAVDWPVTYVQGGACNGGLLAGLHVLAIDGAPVETVWREGQPVGRVFKDAWARHLLVGDLRPAEPNDPRPVQADDVLQTLETTLGTAGMDMSNLARTWFFLDDLLAWYDSFNEVRTRFFTKRGMLRRFVPASTGISAQNVSASAASLGAWAVEPFGGGFSLCEVASPMQGPAPAYGSSFSRAIEMRTPELKRLLISGTASISPDGRSEFLGDTAAQIGFTMDVVRAILRSREMDFGNVSRATAYLKHAQDACFFQAWLAREGLHDWPVFCTHAGICREELLFEIELDALGLETAE